ncbi:S-formylglutathione hydrolase [Ephemeroptericola cinctiostellae]|nr:S-formylglutathione hydrolase [Ephemeroptericola cinctiostellae]
MSIQLLKSHTCYGGTVAFWSHASASTQTEMRFSTFIPECGIECVQGALIWLSGLTCTEENAMSKAGAQQHLAKHHMMMICPDTSPRGLNLPHEHDAYDFGSGAGFYVDATTEGYRDHYNMYSYIVNDVVGLLRTYFKINVPVSISGHSMGGHGALTIGLKHPELFASISAFSPITQPSQSAWGQKALSGYLSNDPVSWRNYDSCALLDSGHTHPHSILIDQGLDDEFYPAQLRTAEFEATCDRAKQSCIINYQANYDHSYYFIATFMKQHIEFHARAQESHL